MTTSVYRGPVLTDTGYVLIQWPDENRWGFSLHDDDQTWPGGLGPWSEWEVISRDNPRITGEDRQRIDDILAQIADNEGCTP
jgi:hypothetical protein